MFWVLWNSLHCLCPSFLFYYFTSYWNFFYSLCPHRLYLSTLYGFPKLFFSCILKIFFSPQCFVQNAVVLEIRFQLKWTSLLGNGDLLFSTWFCFMTFKLLWIKDLNWEKMKLNFLYNHYLQSNIHSTSVFMSVYLCLSFSPFFLPKKRIEKEKNRMKHL